MKSPVAVAKTVRKAPVLAGAMAIAVAINLVLLLLIAALVNGKVTEQTPTPKMQPVEFIRVAPKPPEPKPTAAPPPEKTIVESVDPPTKPQKRTIRKQSPSKKLDGKKVPSKSSTQVAAPKLDIPLGGTGSSFASVAGQDSRLTAPPAKWDVDKKPEEAPKTIPLSRHLVAVSRVMPVYPWRAKTLGVEGWVKLEITVAPDGTVSEASVLSDEPKGTFAEAAIRAIKQWRFRPAFHAGHPVEQRAIQLMEFRLGK
jgi:protein TonB